MAHYEPPHKELRFLQIQLFSSLVLKKVQHGKSQNHIGIKGGVCIKVGVTSCPYGPKIDVIDFDTVNVYKKWMDDLQILRPFQQYCSRIRTMGG